MNDNPYQSPESGSSPTAQRRSVGWYFSAFWLLILTGTVFAVPGLLLLNEEMQWFSSNTSITGISINGQSISNQTVIVLSLGIGALLVAIAAAALSRAFANWRYNKRLTKGVHCLR